MYIIIKNKKVSELEKEVNTYIKSGWVVAGGLMVRPNSYINDMTIMYYQAMVKPL